MSDVNDTAKPDDGNLERALSQLVPVESAVDRDQLMYQAGWEAGRATVVRRPTASIWKATTGLMTAASLGLGIMLVQQNDQGDAGASATASVANTDNHPKLATAAMDTGESDVGETSAKPESATAGASPPPRYVTRARRYGDPASNYLALREVVLTRGVESWPVRYNASSDLKRDERAIPPSANSRELLEQMLRQTGESGPRANGEEPLGNHSSVEEQTV